MNKRVAIQKKVNCSEIKQCNVKKLWIWRNKLIHGWPRRIKLFDEVLALNGSLKKIPNDCLAVVKLRLSG